MAKIPAAGGRVLDAHPSLHDLADGTKGVEKGVYRSRKPCAAVSQFMCRATRRKASGALHRNPRNEKGLAIIDRQALVVRGAQGRNRTTDTGIFSPLLYRLSYLGTKMAGSRGFEPPISGLTGRRVWPLHHEPALVGGRGFEPLASCL